MKKSKTCFRLFTLFVCIPLIVCIGFLLFPLPVNAQFQSEKGLPFITNYLAKTYKAFPQTWCVQEDDRGIMYFGVQSYILEYDGVKWRKITFEVNSASNVVRSMSKNKDGVIYYGGYGDLGYLAKDSLGQIKSKSLLDIIPKSNRNFLDIWTTYTTETSIYFQSREYIFRMEEKKSGEKREVRIWKPQTKFMYAFYLDGNYYVHQQGLGLYKMANDSLVFIPGSEFLGKERMQIMLPFSSPEGGGREGAEKQYLIGMFYGGLYIYNGNTFRPFSTKADVIFRTGALLYKGLLLKNGDYVLSTTGKGIVIIDADGNLLQKINRDVGLQDESIYSTYQDKKGTLWLALDNGISRVETASPLTQFTLQSGINTGVLTMKRVDGALYIGTSNGLLLYDSTKQFFEPVPGVPKNQIYTLLPDGNELLVPGDGLFVIKDKKTFNIRPSVSADLALSALYISRKNPDILVVGGPFGAAVFTRKKRSLSDISSSPWNFAGYVPGISEQIWTFSENKDGKIWAGSANGVVYRLALVFDENGNLDLKKTVVDEFGAAQGLKNGVGNVFYIKGTNYFVADSTLYTFDENKKQFIPDTTFGKFLKGGAATEFVMVEDQQGRVWIRAGKETRIATPKPGGGYRFDNTRLNSIAELTVQYFYPEKNGIVWICTTDGLIRYDENLEKNNEGSFKTILRHIAAGKKALNTNITDNNKQVSISFNNNTLRFEYAAPFFEQEDKTQYQTWLEGFEDNWSDWDNNYYKEYTNIPDGKYVFHVRAKNIYEKLSEEAVYSFTVLPPWYRTWWAYLLYALSAAVIIYSLIRWRTRQLHEKHRELEKTVADRTAQLSNRVEELAVINSVQEGLVREMDMQGIYELVGEKIREIFNAQVIDIVTYDSSTNLLEDRYAYEKGDRTLVGTWEPAGFRKLVIDTGQLILINEDLDKKSIEFNSKVIYGEPPKSAIFVPLITAKEVKGIISLQDLDKENAFSDSDVSLLTTLANSMSVALESARRFDETNRLLKDTEQRTAELAVINSVQEGLAKELDMQGIYDLVGDRVQKLFNAQAVIIATFDHEKKLEYFNYQIEKGEITHPDPRPFDKVRQHLIQTGQNILINENFPKAAAEFGMSVIPGTEAPKSLLFMPMKVGDKVTGYVSLQNIDEEHAFSFSDVRLLSTLSNSMSVALENARLFDETNRLLKETEQRNAELAVINSVQESLVAKMDIQGIYELVGEKIREIFDAQVIDIFTYDKNANLIEDRYSYEKGDRTLLGQVRPYGFRKHVIQTRQLLLHNENVEQASRDYDNPILIGEMPKSQMYVPMIAGDEVKGIISLQNLDHEHAFSNSDVNLLTTLANSMSVALESARLFDETSRLLKETEQRTAELAIINSVQEGLARELDIQGIYELVGEKIRKIFNAQVIDIVTYDSTTNLMEDRYSYEKGDRTLGGTWEPTGFRKLVIDTCQLLLINEDLDKKSIEYNSKVIQGEQPKSAVFVPLITRNNVNGMISLQDLDKEHAFTDSNVNLLTTLANSMSVALESARRFDETNRLLKETEQRNAELAVINSVQESLVAKMDIQGIYELVGEKIREIFDAQVIDIVTYDKNANLISDRYAFEKGDRTLLGPRQPNGFRKYVIRTRQLLLHNENVEQKTMEFDNEILIGEMPKSQMYVPMIHGDEVKGIISLQNLDHEHAFSNSDVNLLTTLANSMSVALESARLFDETTRLLKETEQRTAELAVINSVQQGLAKELDMQAIYELVGERIRELFDAQSVSIATFNHEAKTEKFQYLIEKEERYYPEARPFDKLRQHLIQTGEKILININTEEIQRKFGLNVVPGTERPKSMLFVPLAIGDKVTSYVSLQNVDKENAFSDSDVRLLETLANSMSVALENARLFDETTRLLKETEQRTAELAVINSVQEGLAKELDIQGIYELVGEKMREIFNAQVIDIVTYDKITNLIEDRYTFEKGDRVLLGPRPLKGFRKHVIETAKPLVINKDVDHLRSKYDNTVIVGEAAKSLVLVPMTAGGEVTGVISLQNLDKENAFPDSDVNLLTTLSNSMSVALENARLFDETNRLLKETEQRTAELAVINSVQDGLAKELDIQGIYDLVGNKIRDLFDAQAVIIATFDNENGTEHFKYVIEDGKRFYLDPRPYDKLRQHLIQTRQKIVINKNYEEAYTRFGLKTLPGTKMTKSGVFVPLFIGDKINSYISLQNMDHENAFSESDVRLLETLSNSMSVALENARLFDETNRLLKETEQRTAELAVINSVQEGLAKELDMQGIYNLVGDRVQKLFNAQAVIIASFDLENKTEHFNYLFENGEKVKAEPRPITKFRQLLIDKKHSIYIPSEEQAEKEYGLTTTIAGTQKTKTLLFVPLLTGNIIRGYVSLQNIDIENAFSESDIRLLETLANSMSVALENARLFDETNRLLKETEQRTAELAVINSVQDGLVREMDMQGIYTLVGDRIRDLFDAQVVIIATFHHEKNQEYFNYYIEKGERSNPKPRLLDSLRKHLIKSRQLILLNENVIEAIPKFGLKVIPGTELPKSMLFVPLVVGEKVNSYVSLQNIDKENAFSESDVRLLSTLTNSMSVALENARLFDETNRLLKETEQRTAELAVINSVQDGLAKELDMEGIYNLVGDRVQKLFNAQVVIISSFDFDNKTEHFNYFFENEEKVKAEPRPINKLRQLLIDKKHSIYIPTQEQAEKEYGLTSKTTIAGTQNTKSLLFVPLLTGNIIRGYVSLQNIDIENAFSESDIRLLETLANSMSVALENARLFDETSRLLKETEQRTAELAVINSVQEGLAKELDMQGIYDLVGDRLCSLFPDTQTLVIRTFDHETGLEHFQYAIEKGIDLKVAPRPFMWANKSLIETKKPIDIRENYVETAKMHGGTGVTKGQPPKCAVFVPMLVGEVVKGSISLQNVDKENAFTDSDLRLLTTITNSMSVALENARLFDETNRLLKETEQRTGELAVINSVQEGLVREMDIQAIYDLVGNRICELFDTQTVLIRTFDHDTGNEHWRYAIEKGQRQYSEPRPFIWANRQLIQTQKPIHINENYVETAKKYGGTGVSIGKPPKSAVFVPMIVGDVVKGSVSLQNVDKENAYTEADLRLLTTLTNSMSVALENARLFDETTLLLAEAKQRATELSTVNSISKALASQLNPDDLIKLVGDKMKNLFKANIVYLALFNQKTKTIHFPYQYGDDMPPMKLGEGLTSKIILTGEPLLINKNVGELRAQLGVKRVGIPASSYLGVPIPIGDEIIGVLSVQSTEHENSFNENDQRLLSTIASSVGVALKNATLFEDVKLAKMEAETAGKLAEKANEAKSAFLSTVSHELRTPLTSVLGFAKIIRKRLDEKIFPTVDKTDPKTEKTIHQISENLQVVISEGERLTHLINDVLDLAKIEAGKMEWNQEIVSMSEVAERAIAATTALFDQKSLKLIKQIDNNLPEITGDKDKLIQVIINLISNSVKFTDKGSVTCKVFQKKDELIVSITDTGIGIAAEDFDAVFEQFKQVGGDTLTDKPKGTGLGLPICKEIVEHHSGRIWLESKPGKGSTFSFSLPVSKSITTTRPIHLEDLVKQLKEQVAQTQLNIKGKSAYILIVDDDDSIRSLLQQELGDAGYLIEEARNGKEALACVRKQRPDLIILDIMMPEMNGFDVAAILKNDPQTMDIPIIVLSIVQDKTRGFRIGVDRYLTKPIDTGILFSEIDSLLEQGKSRKKVMIVDEDTGTVNTLTEVLKTKGYVVLESDGKELIAKAVANQPDIIIINSVLSTKQDIVKTLRFEKGLENVLFLVYQ